MSDPKRLRDEGSEEMRALFRAGAPTRRMTAEERARTRDRIGRYVAAATVAAALSWVPGAALGAALGLVAVAAMYVVPAWIAPRPAPSTPALPPIPTAVPTASAALPEPPPPPSAIPSAEPPAPRAPAAPPSSASSAAPPADLLAEEVALLDRARAALGTNPAAALALAGDHASRFPQGKLGMEREIVAVDALRRLGRSDEARARGDLLLDRARGSLYEERVKKLVEGSR